jgi:hypothetical protein
VVGYNDLQITNCEVGECLFSGIYGWGSSKSSGKPWFLPVGNTCKATTISPGDRQLEIPDFG